VEESLDLESLLFM